VAKITLSTGSGPSLVARVLYVVHGTSVETSKTMEATCWKVTHPEWQQVLTEEILP